MAKKPVVDKEKCIGCGTCEVVCTAVFKLGDDGKAHVLPDVDCKKAGCCEEAAESCPVEAITFK